MQTQYRKKPPVFTAITFDQLIAHGIAQCKEEGRESNIIDGRPWSFDYKCYPITHERDDCYNIPTRVGGSIMGPDDMLVIDEKGAIEVCRRAEFEATHEPVGVELQAILVSDNGLGALDRLSEEDAAVEHRVVQVGAGTAPRVTPADIDALMARVVISYEHRPNGSTLTFAHALLDGEFYLASGFSACVSAENYNAEIGQQVATDKVLRSARDKLWELEGYRLRATVASDAEFVGGSMEITD
ncbi:MAG: Gp49 family protein [Comamonas sp.]